MTTWIVAPVLALSLAAAVWTVVMIVRAQHPPSDAYFVLLGALLVLLVVQMVVGFVALGATDRPVEGVTFVAYLLTTVAVVPVGAALALVERSRWGTAVLLVAVLTVAACELRLEALWDVAAVAGA
ncbi:hypothetical protein [Nocardioides bruguierae]|uniref:Uncharacterized protein n=1 Tax=Nocardioides bruguierae TaxID=2945102 RepID=A0A9X2IE24_9ACTN|nr:hypothetical protein [Nocardioides bruguierae]MCL8024442.1 hypothetical protein [Nocardioides bruguierae]MCM0618909.1 hypothetical protein [Nocardioides bruguierae]